MLSAPSADGVVLAEVVFLLDVDNTLLDNDRFIDDLRNTLTASFGASECDRYFSIYEKLRVDAGYADYLGALQRFRQEVRDQRALLSMSGYLLGYPFADRVYPQALEVIAHLRQLAPTVILSDGDIVFQPRKVVRSGLFDAVDGEVIIDVHKEQELAAMQRCYPAQHYVMVDDKPKILSAMKQQMGDRLTTVFVRQGHYAAAAGDAITPVPDLTIDRIGELVQRMPRDLPAGVSARLDNNASRATR